MKLSVEEMIAEDEADIQAMREMSDDVTADEYAKGVAQDLDDLAEHMNGYQSLVDCLKARAFAIRKRHNIF